LYDILTFIKLKKHFIRKTGLKNPILKWETKAWGEIPADFGRK
jgi:ribonuclease HI